MAANAAMKMEYDRPIADASGEVVMGGKVGDFN